MPEPVHEALPGPPPYGLASIGDAASRENDTIDALVTRARTDHGIAPPERTGPPCREGRFSYDLGVKCGHNGPFSERMRP